MDPRQVKFSVQAWEHFPSHGNAYLYARLLDWGVGEGVVEIDVKTMAIDLALAPRTCQDYLRRCKREGFFYRVTWLNGGATARVHYVATAKVMANLGMVNHMLSDKISIDELKHKKVITATAAAQCKQEQSFHQCEETTPGYKHQGRNLAVPKPVSYFGRRASSSAPGGNSFVQYRTKRFTFVKASTPLYGASQPAIAAVLGRSPRTIRRRLSAPYAQQLAARLGSDLTPVPKMQLAIEVGPSSIADLDRAENFGATRLIQAFGKSWNPKCNLYLCDRELRGCSRLNKSIKRLKARGYTGA